MTVLIKLFMLMLALTFSISIFSGIVGVVLPVAALLLPFVFLAGAAAGGAKHGTADAAWKQGIDWSSGLLRFSVKLCVGIAKFAFSFIKSFA